MFLFEVVFFSYVTVYSQIFIFSRNIFHEDWSEGLGFRKKIISNDFFVKKWECVDDFWEALGFFVVSLCVIVHESKFFRCFVLLVVVLSEFKREVKKR